MGLTRRNFIVMGATSFFVSRGVFANNLVGISDVAEWEKLGRKWMAVLLPADHFSQGGEANEFQNNVLMTISLSEILKAKMSQGFQMLKDQPLPSTFDQVNQILLWDAPPGLFLKEFSSFLQEQYYGSKYGWHDLGFSHPPQPNGFSY